MFSLTAIADLGLLNDSACANKPLGDKLHTLVYSISGDILIRNVLHSLSINGKHSIAVERTESNANFRISANISQKD